MKRILLGTVALVALATAPALAQQKTIKIGFISSFSGPAAAIGNDMRNSFELALDHHGRKLGGLPVEVIYEDDQIKPEVGVQKTQKLIESDKVDFIVGYIWSNVLLASLKPIVDSKTFLVITNAGASQVAGELCSPYVFSTSWNNDQTPQAVGLYMNQKGVKSAFLIGPNYAAGKDMLEGVKATFKGQIVGQELTRWPDQLDFSAELSKARAAKPDAIFAFYPGGAGIQFVTQYAQSGLKGQIPLYTAFTIDELSLPRMKGPRRRYSRRAAVGQRSAERREQEVRRRLQGEVQRPRHRSTAHRPMTRSLSSKALSSRSRATSPRKTRCARRWRRPTSSRFAATSSSAPITSRFRTSTCRMW
jgi:branched-chain amino acid transport system substrate-binding protein